MSKKLLVVATLLLVLALGLVCLTGCGSNTHPAASTFAVGMSNSPPATGVMTYGLIMMVGTRALDQAREGNIDVGFVNANGNGPPVHFVYTAMMANFTGGTCRSSRDYFYWTIAQVPGTTYIGAESATNAAGQIGERVCYASTGRAGTNEEMGNHNAIGNGEIDVGQTAVQVTTHYAKPEALVVTNYAVAVHYHLLT